MSQIPKDSLKSQASAAQTATPQQQKAIDTKHVSVVLSAGAGCGKTTVLTGRFLSHLEPGRDAADLSSLVAITFTEKAAREMRERIRKRCLDRLRTCPADQVEHWLKIVRELDSARISTIHSFCASLLRANAVEAGIDPAFGLLDEMLGSSFLQQSVDIGMQELLAANDADIAELIFEFGLSGTRERLASLILQRYRIESSNWESLTGQELAENLENIWRTEHVPKLLRELAESETAKQTLRLLKKHEPRNNVLRERFDALLECIPRLTNAGDAAEALDVIRENARIQGGGTKKDWGHKDDYDAVKDAFTDLRARVEKVQSQLEYDPEHLLRGAEIGLCALRAAVKVGERYDARKAEAGVLDFDDLLIGARDLLRDHPDVRRRIEAGIKLLMVDEFQDTDPVQDQIVRYLCGKHELTGRLFVVGDSKQSIYRFRRAEPKVFHELRDRVAQAGRLPLNVNFRSRPEILAFVNAMFDGALGDAYESLEPEPQAQAQTPCIEFLFAAAGADEVEANPDIDQSAAARRRREAEWIAGRLTQVLADGEPRVHVRGKQSGEFTYRKVEFRDIVILFRAMSDVRYYEEALRAHNLPYYVVGGRAFFAQQEIFDVVNLCQYLDDVDDEVALIGVLRSPFFSLSDDSIVALGQSPTQALGRAPPPFLPEQQQEQVRRAGAVLAELRAKKDHLPISRLLTLAIESTGYDASLLTEFLGERKLANLRKLIDMARTFDQSGLFTLADFVDRLRDSVADETYEPLAATHPESANVIRLMSIHQSKGLEFPVVVVADMDRQGRDQLSAAHFDPQLGPLLGLPEKFGVKRDHPGLRMSRSNESEQDLAEARRVLYVAMTRAADLLILSANLKKAGQPANEWLKLVNERFDLKTGQPRTKPTEEGVSVVVKEDVPAIHVHHKKPEAMRLPQPSEIQKSAEARHDDSPGDGPIPLRQLRETIDGSEPGELPKTMEPIPPDQTARRWFSVSEIETLDQQIRGTPPAHHQRERLGGPSVGADFSSNLPADLSSAEQLGTLVHAVLERLDFQKPQDAETLLDRLSSFSAGSIDSSARKAASACVANLVGSPLGADLAFALQIHREIDFLLRFPPVVISGTIDCLFESADGTWTVLDYKTGIRDKSTSATELLADYEIQLGLYALAVREYLKRLPDRIELAFLRNGVDRVAFVPTEAKLAEITARVARALTNTTVQ